MSNQDLRGQCNNINFLLGKAMAHPLMPREATNALSAVGVLLSNIIDRIELLDKDHRALKAEVLGRIL